MDFRVPQRIDENIIDIDGTMVESWRLGGDPARLDELEPVPGVQEFLSLRPHPQKNTILSHAKLSELYQRNKIKKFQLLEPFEQPMGGGIFICEQSEQKRQHLQNLVKRFLHDHAHGDVTRLAVIGNNPSSELLYGLELGLTVIRIRQHNDPYSEATLHGPHYECRDWFEVMELPFFKPQYSHVLLQPRRA